METGNLIFKNIRQGRRWYSTLLLWICFLLCLSLGPHVSVARAWSPMSDVVPQLLLFGCGFGLVWFLVLPVWLWSTGGDVGVLRHWNWETIRSADYPESCWSCFELHSSVLLTTLCVAEHHNFFLFLTHSPVSLPFTHIHTKANSQKPKWSPEQCCLNKYYSFPYPFLLST